MDQTTYGDLVLKKFLFLMVLVFVTVYAVEASAGAAKPVATRTPAQGGRPTNTVDALSFGHSKAIPADTQLVNSGKVLEVLETDMYTYLQVTTEKGPLWIATYKTNVSKGATVRYSNGVAMSDFFSNVLNRAFDVIVFVDSLELVK
jgi:uncharacterized protein YdeI (BOF family)